jgi:hypothetical protein
MAYVIILAEFAKKIAVREKNSPGSTPAHKGPLLAVMRAAAGNLGELSCPAKTSVARHSVNPAHARTHRTLLHPFGRAPQLFSKAPAPASLDTGNAHRLNLLK